MLIPQRLLLAICVPFLLGLVALMGFRSASRFVDTDEFEHLNSAYFMSRGETIYGSFFENHPPLTAILLQPVVRGPEDPRIMIQRGRGLMLVLSGAILVAVGAWARPIAGWFAAVLAPTLLLSTMFFVQKAIEVRPDVPALLCLVLALLILRHGLDGASWGWPFLAGAMFCIAGLFTPKVIYSAAGATLAACVVAGNSGWRRALRMFGLIVSGALLVTAITAIELGRRGLLDGFLSDAVGTSLSMRLDDPGLARWLFLKMTLSHSAVVWGLTLLGIVVVLRRCRDLPRGFAEILCSSWLAGVAGFFINQAPTRQYFLTFLPQTAILATAGLTWILSWIAARWPRPLMAGVLLAALLGATVPLAQAERGPVNSMRVQLTTIDKVRELTTRDDRVLDCWTGLYLTRLPAYRYFYLNSDMLRLIPSNVLESDLLQSLESRRLKLLIVDQNLRKLPSTVLMVIGRDFAPVPDFPSLLLRR